MVHSAHIDVDRAAFHTVTTGRCVSPLAFTVLGSSASIPNHSTSWERRNHGCYPPSCRSGGRYKTLRNFQKDPQKFRVIVINQHPRYWVSSIEGSLSSCSVNILFLHLVTLINASNSAIVQYSKIFETVLRIIFASNAR